MPPDERGADSGPPDFGTAYRVRAALRRRLGLALVRLRHPRVTFGPLCDVRSGARFTVARGAASASAPAASSTTGSPSRRRAPSRWGTARCSATTAPSPPTAAWSIGRGCLIGELVSIRDHDHAFDRDDVAILDQGRATAPVVIGDDVWVGAKATITRGVTIGSGHGGRRPRRGHPRPARRLRSGRRARPGGAHAATGTPAPDGN